MKMIIYLDQVGCSPAILGWFSIQKSVSITYHTESLKTNSWAYQLKQTKHWHNSIFIFEIVNKIGIESNSF